MKIKLFKIVISIIAFTYVFSTVGISVISHYCGGELEAVALFSKPTSCCGEEEEAMDDGCCKNETTHVSFQKDFTFYTVTTECKAFVYDLFIVKPSFIQLAIQNNSESFFLHHKKNHPPNLVQHAIVSISVIRI